MSHFQRDYTKIHWRITLVDKDQLEIDKDQLEIKNRTQHYVILAIGIAFEIRRYSDQLLEEMLLQKIFTQQLIQNLFHGEKIK